MSGTVSFSVRPRWSDTLRGSSRLAANPTGSHLDQKEGRIFLRLELEALKQALQAETFNEMQTHLTSAMVFRSSRYQLYPSAAASENQLELNEGIAEYTGMVTSGGNRQEMLRRLEKYQLDCASDSSMLRSFACQTVPAYGFLLSTFNPAWNKSITQITNLTATFIRAFGLQMPDDPGMLARSLKGRYNGPSIEKEENAREIQ